MRIQQTATRSVNPVVAAIAIILVLGAVQYWWWMKLVAKPNLPSPPRPNNSRMGGGPVPSALGRKDVSVVTLAGDPAPGDADGPGHAARFDGPSGLAVDPLGRVVVADTRNNRIRLITPGGHTSTIAGSAAGFRDGDLGQALFSGPSGVAVASDGAIYVADTGNQRIRMVKNGQVSTIAGSSEGFADGPGTTARFHLPAAISLDAASPDGKVLIVSDAGNRALRKLTRAGSGWTISTLPQSARDTATAVVYKGGVVGAAFPGQGRLSLGGSSIVRQKPIELGEDTGTPQGGVAPPNGPKVHQPASLCLIGDEWVFADATYGAVLTVHRGSVEVVAGVCNGRGPVFGFRDGHGDRCLFGAISGIAADGNGHLFVSDSTNNAIRRVSMPGRIADRPSAP